MYKQHNLVMLPADKAPFPHLGLNEWDNTLHLVKSTETIPHTPQYLYITSDEEIKEGDWVIQTDLDPVKHNVVMKVANLLHPCKKIIATTNPDLWFAIMPTATYSVNRQVLAKIPDSLIQYFVEQQGKVDKVMVEYELYQTYPRSGRDFQGNEKYDYRLKLNPDGTINWKPVEEDWNQIIQAYLDESDSTFPLPLRVWLRNNYHPPKKK